MNPDSLSSRSDMERAERITKKLITAILIAAVLRGGTGKRDRLKPDDDAEGPNTVFRRDSRKGRVSRYETYRPQTDSQDPNKCERIKPSMQKENGILTSPHNAGYLLRMSMAKILQAGSALEQLRRHQNEH